MQKKYRALRILRTLYLIAAVLTGILTIAAVLVSLFLVVAPPYRDATYGIVFDNRTSGIIAALTSLVIGLLTILVLVASANRIDAMIDTEENTRATAILLRRLVERTSLDNR